MADRHKYNPVRLRTPDYEWLARYAQVTGRTVPNALAEAIAIFRESVERGSVDTWREKEE